MLVHYNPIIAQHLMQGFTNGFRIQYSGPRIARDCKNLPSALQMPDVMQAKIDKEVKAGRYLGPFDKKPYDNLINFPIAHDKTCWATQRMDFLGLGLDSVAMIIFVPREKCQKALDKIDAILRDLNGKPRHKVRVQEIASLAGLLNFLCKAVRVGRPFLSRLYFAVGNLPQHYHVSVTTEIKKDLCMWREFLSSYSCSTPFPSVWSWTNEQLEFYTDSAGSIGFGIYFQGRWTQGRWPKQFLEEVKPSIALLEFFPIVMGLYIWCDHLKDRKVVFHSDNMAVVNIVNKQYSGCKYIMALVRLFVITCLTNNITFKSQFVPGRLNDTADALSRFQMDRFWRIVGGEAQPDPTPLPKYLWPISADMLSDLPY